MQQVSLPETGAAVDEEGVVGPAWALGHGRGSGRRELVALRDDVVGEGEAIIQPRGPDGGGGSLVHGGKWTARPAGFDDFVAHAGGTAHQAQERLLEEGPVVVVYP